MLKQIVTLPIALLALPIIGCDGIDPMAGIPPAPASAKSADWNAYRNCRQRLQFAKTNGEIDADRLKERVAIECENGFTPASIDKGAPGQTTGSSTR